MAIDTRPYIGLSEEDIELLVMLDAIGAATPLELEIKTGRIGDDTLQTELEGLKQRGLIKAYITKQGYEDQIYQVSRKGRKIIR